ncbi:hypothetical protein B0T18DRAFT_426006 [Schizothecium vesticola]|uniref:Uncharacterized protein n=1 Tax=Schizothecium vesticola TaxID=314040 RepID=A0AA40KAD7_9PEZI|nr:hypothetical protein B0T18DRAFT_426006 [Schizothecium vesticola]
MLSRGLLPFLTFLPTSLALTHGQETPQKFSCGEINVLFTGLPPYHPLVKAQGADPAQVDAALRADAANIRKQGYNLRVILLGPEKNITTLTSYLGIPETADGTPRPWDGTGVGFGVRGSAMAQLTVWFEEVVTAFRTGAPRAPIMFDFSPGTAGWAVERHFPIEEDCEAAGREGGDLRLADWA